MLVISNSVIIWPSFFALSGDWAAQFRAACYQMFAKEPVQGEFPHDIGLPKPFSFLSLPDLEKKIKQAKTTGTLNISNQGLSILPREILSVKGMITFLASNNAIPHLPNGFCTRLFAITKLSLHDNRLTQLPGDFGVLANLEVLDLSYNSFAAFPENVRKYRSHVLIESLLFSPPTKIGSCTKLQEIDFGWNRLQYIPGSVFPKLKYLKKLTLCGNQLTALPREIGQCTLLTLLVLRNNKLTRLPPELG